jgi:Ser/Thr protein kinase RdoA (MazF antagonist)
VLTGKTMSDVVLRLQELAEAALAKYELSKIADIKLINLSENATYKIETVDGQCFALRIHREGYHCHAAIASELSWMMALREASVAITPVPLKGIDGERIQSVVVSDTLRHAVLFQWEDGAEPLMSEALSKPFEALGEVTARMHMQARRWQRPDWFQRFTWDFESSLGEDAPHWGKWRDGMGVQTEHLKLFTRTVEKIEKRLVAYGKNAARFGLIHGDLRLSNLLISQNEVKVIDFDDSGFGWFMYDAATPISFYEDDQKVPELLDAWKTGYRRVSPIQTDDEAEIPTFIMLRRLLLVAWISSHHETELAQSMGVAYTNGSLALCENYLTLM